MKKKQFWVILVFTGLILFGILSLIPHNIKYRADFNKFEELNTSDAIDVNTPENKSYTEPMYGYFAGTDSFEHVAHQDFPDYWIDRSTSSGAYTRVEDQIGSGQDAHMKVLDIYDQTNAGYGRPELMFTESRTYGTIEFWFRTNNKDKYCMIHTKYGSSTADSANRMKLQLYHGEWRYSTGYSYYYLKNYGITQAPASNTWYHMKIDFRGNTGVSWQGIGTKYRWRVTISNGIPGDAGVITETSSNFNWYLPGRYPGSAIGEMSRIYFSTAGSENNYHMYIDAVGFDFDPNYNMGDNEAHGLLLDYTESVGLDSIEYSLDGGAHKSIKGDAAIPLPSTGSHDIQIFGEAAGGIPYQSAKRYFNVYIGADVPDVPSSLECIPGYKHLYLDWNSPSMNGAPFISYHVYRGNSSGGLKKLIASPTTAYYNDSEVGDYVGEDFFYVITAENAVGNSSITSEVSGIVRDQPFIQWESPNENARIVFGTGPAIFNISYYYIELFEIHLVINGTDYGNIKDQYSITLPWSDNINGPVTAVLEGYEESNPTPIVTDSRDFIFVKLIFEVIEILDQNSTILGKELYLILHDPNGDCSYSSFSENTVLSFGHGFEITTTQAYGVGVEASFSLFGIESGASNMLTLSSTTETGFDFSFEVSETTSLTSNLNSENPDYIGPGYGDTYWGESWLYKWVLKAYRRIYSNDTTKEVYEEPKLYYGILRDVETLVSDINAPTEWRDQNPVHNGWKNASWDRYLYADGGIEYYENFEVTNTISRSSSFVISISNTAASKLAIVKLEWTLEHSTKVYVEGTHGTSIETSFLIHDDDVTDRIVQGIGIDRNFGTFLFNTSSFFTETSNPLEHNTFDYIPPVIEMPDCIYDSNGDGQCPCEDDSPFITVDIFDEGGIQEAIAKYSIDNGNTWFFSNLTEQSGNPGTWEGSLPRFPVNTKVLWYIIAWDLEGWNATRYDTTDLPFEYKVLAKTQIPGYSTNLIIVVTVIATIGIGIKVCKKRIFN